MDDKEVVAAVLAALAEKIGADRFELWFGANVRVAAGQSTLVVSVPNEFHQNWLRRNFRGDLEVEFRVAAALDPKNKIGGSLATDRQQRFEFEEPIETSVDQTDTATLVIEPPKRHKPAVAPAPSLSLGRKYAPLDSFVVGSS